MTTLLLISKKSLRLVVEAYRLDRYDNCNSFNELYFNSVVEAYRLDRYDNALAALLARLTML